MKRMIDEMNGVEFERFYNCGEMPERFWPEEIAKLRNEYAEGKLLLYDYEDSLDDLMGLTNA